MAVWQSELYRRRQFRHLDVAAEVGQYLTWADDQATVLLPYYLHGQFPTEVLKNY